MFVERRNAIEVGAPLGLVRLFGEVFVSRQLDGQAHLVLDCVGVHDSEDSSPAAEAHALGEGYLGRHPERYFHGRTDINTAVGIEKCSPRAQILRQSRLTITSVQPQHNRYLKLETLTTTTLVLQGGVHG